MSTPRAGHVAARTRVLIIAEMDLTEEFDCGGEIGEVSQSVTDRALAMVETVPLPSGNHGWKDCCHLRLPVGFLPPEWSGKRVRVTFEIEPCPVAEAPADLREDQENPR